MEAPFDLDSALAKARLIKNEPKRLIEYCDTLLHTSGIIERDRAELHLMKGIALRSMGQLDPAGVEFRLAAELAATAENDGLIARSYMQYGAILIERHDFENARKYLTLARDKFILGSSVAGEAHVLSSLSNIYLIEKRYTEARLTLNDALSKYNEIGNVEGMSQVIATSALVFMLEGQYEESIERFLECERLFLDVSDRKNALASMLNRAECYIKLQKLSYAEVLLCSIRERARSHDFHILEARALLVMSNLCQRQGEISDAGKHFYDARQLAILHGFEELFDALVVDMQLA